MAYLKTTAGMMGFLPTAPANSVSAQNLNAAATWVALSFIAKSSNLNEVLVYGVLTGTLVAADITCTIYSDTSAQPGSVIEARNCSATPATGFNSFTGFTSSLTVGTRYWCVFKNLNATPASNFLAIRYASNGALPFQALGSNVISGWAKRHSTDSGATWAAGNVAGTAGVFLSYDTSGTPTYDGFALNTIGLATAVPVYSTREYGVIFTTPSTGNFKVAGATFLVYRNLNPTGNVVYKIYEGTTLLGTTYALPLSNTSNGISSWVTLHFASTLTLAPNTSHRVVIAETTNSDSSSNYYTTYRYTLSTATGVRTVLPFNNTLQQTYYDGSSWTEDSGFILPFGLVFDVDAEIASSGGGGGSTFIYNLME